MNSTKNPMYVQAVHLMKDTFDESLEYLEYLLWKASFTEKQISLEIKLQWNSTFDRRIQ